MEFSQCLRIVAGLEPHGHDHCHIHILKRKTETIGGQWSPSHATGFEGGDDPGDELVAIWL